MVHELGNPSDVVEEKLVLVSSLSDRYDRRNMAMRHEAKLNPGDVQQSQLHNP